MLVVDHMKLIAQQHLNFLCFVEVVGSQYYCFNTHTINITIQVGLIQLLIIYP